MDNIITPLTSDTPSLTAKLSQPPAKISKMGSTGSSSSWNRWTILKILLIIIIISALGFNLLAYLAQGTDYLSKLVESGATYLPSGFGRTLQMSAAGTALGGEIAAGTITDVDKVITGAASPTDTTPNEHKEIWDKRNQNLSDAVDKRHIQGVNQMPEHEPDESDSTIQHKQKGGWCYVGTDRGFRSCVKIEDSQRCMSGKIFPTKTICINPNLRE